VADYRDQVTQLNAALAENPAARLEAIPRLRALIDTIVLTPAEDRGVDIEVTGRLSSMLALAGGKAVNVAMYGNDGAGEGNRALPQFLRVAV
jgi:hypothetical protein